MAPGNLNDSSSKTVQLQVQQNFASECLSKSDDHDDHWHEPPGFKFCSLDALAVSAEGLGVESSRRRFFSPRQLELESRCPSLCFVSAPAVYHHWMHTYDSAPPTPSLLLGPRKEPVCGDSHRAAPRTVHAAEVG